MKKRLLSLMLVMLLFVSPLFADIYVIHSCSGSGKDTIVSAVCETLKGIHYIPAVTTRKPRPNEKEGVDMFFVSKETFEKMDQNKEILNRVNIHGNSYGGNKKYLQSVLDRKEDAILIGKFGEVAKDFPDVPVHHVGIFITKETQKKRLAGRGTETKEAQDERVSRYDKDMTYAKKYVTFKINNDKDAYVNGHLVKSKLPIKPFIKFILDNRENSNL
jgi:guanylate kinase